MVFPQDLIQHGLAANNFAMLGLGDIVIPGIFIALLLRFDLRYIVLLQLRCGSRARHIYPSLVLVQPRKTLPCLTERLLMGCKESNQTNKPYRPAEFLKDVGVSRLLLQGKFNSRHF